MCAVDITSLKNSFCEIYNTLIRNKNTFLNIIPFPVRLILPVTCLWIRENKTCIINYSHNTHNIHNICV